MISQLYIEGFKRFKAQTMDLQPLTVLAGRNGAGKTSAIHALLLVRHAFNRGDGIAELNGPYGMQLGWFDDLVNINIREASFSIALYTREPDQEVRWVFTPGNTELTANVSSPIVPSGLFSKSHSRSFQYLAAERNGPRITQKASALPTEMLEVGCCGEFVAHVIEKLGSEQVETERLEESDSDSPALVKAQAERWLSKIVRPVELDTATFPNTDVVSLTFRSPGGEWVRPTNMGFGVSYALPVVVAALTAPKNSVLIVENPEAHLHPAGQSEIGAFLARMASAGVQVILETHSDHVLNGIRRAIGEKRVLQAGNAIVHFFPDDESEVQPLQFTETGGINKWPKGFFDQYQLDVAKITQVRRPK